jgi:hypothetical protein
MSLPLAAAQAASWYYLDRWEDNCQGLLLPSQQSSFWLLVDIMYVPDSFVSGCCMVS